MKKNKNQPYYIKEIERLYLQHKQSGSTSNQSSEPVLLKKLLQTIQDIEKKQNRYAMQADEMTDIVEKAMDNQEVMESLNHRINSLNRELAVYKDAFFAFFNSYYILTESLLQDDTVSSVYGEAVKQQQSYLERSLMTVGMVITGSVGEAFNENFHSIEEIINDTSYPEGTVVFVVSKGLVFGGTVLRKAAVKISGRENIG